MGNKYTEDFELYMSIKWDLDRPIELENENERVQLCLSKLHYLEHVRKSCFVCMNQKEKGPFDIHEYAFIMRAIEHIQGQLYALRV